MSNFFRKIRTFRPIIFIRNRNIGACRPKGVCGSGIRALWRSVLSARVPECQKLKMVGKTSMTKCKALTGSAVKGLT